MQFDLYVVLILYRCYACMFYEILAPYLKLIRLMTANHVIAYTCDMEPRCGQQQRGGECVYVIVCIVYDVRVLKLHETNSITNIKCIQITRMQQRQ